MRDSFTYVYYLMIFILPAIMGGVLNMIFVKLPIFKSWKVPMDGGMTLGDGKRIFGKNKTWKGFFGMTVLSGISALICMNIPYAVFLYAPSRWGYVPGSVFFFGAGLGFFYVLFELPNSFIKRRMNIEEGKNGTIIQTFFDQADSVIGCVLFLKLIYPLLKWRDLFVIFVIGTIVHYIINVFLFYVKLKNQKG